MIHSRAPLYSRGFSADINGNLAPLVFYLRRNAPRLAVPLKDAPAGYSIVQIGPVAGDSRLPPRASSCSVLPRGAAVEL